MLQARVQGEDEAKEKHTTKLPLAASFNSAFLYFYGTTLSYVQRQNGGG